MLGVYTRVLKSYSMSTLYALTLLALSALLTLGILDFIRSRLLVKAGVKMDRLMSRPVLKTMIAELSRADSDGYTRGLQDVNTLRNYFSGNAVFAFFDVPWIFIYLGVIFLIHPVLGFTATGGGIVLITVGIIQTLVTRKDHAEINQVKNKEQDFLQRSFRNSHMLRSMGMLGNCSQHWNRINNSAALNLKRSENRSHYLGAVSTSFRSMMQVIIFGVGALLVVLNQANSGVIIAASIIMGRALAPIDQGIGAWKQTSGAVDAYRRLKKLMETRVSGEAIDIDQLEGNLDVINASLELSDKTVLDNVSFSLQKGEVMGLVGHNGAGKTCLCRMLLGMWQPTQGEIKIDGKDIFPLDQDEMGSYIGYLPQDVELFPGTVSSNIARLKKVDSEKVVEAATMAGAHEVILRFPMGYETDIGEAGATLSGGQRQRVGLARALYGNPGLVILDEPNSNLDDAGEAALVGALDKLKQKGTTTIMITHKPELLYHVDKILVLKQGKPVGFGTKEEVFNSFLHTESENVYNTGINNGESTLASGQGGN